MEPEFENKRSYRHIVYAVISVACPFIAYALISLYQEYTYEWLWQAQNKSPPLDDADVNASAMGAIAMIAEAALAVVVGLTIGTVFAVLSLKRKPRLFGAGTVALLFNLIPLLAAVFFFFSVRRGF